MNAFQIFIIVIWGAVCGICGYGAESHLTLPKADYNDTSMRAVYLKWCGERNSHGLLNTIFLEFSAIGSLHNVLPDIKTELLGMVLHIASAVIAYIIMKHLKVYERTLSETAVRRYKAEEIIDGMITDYRRISFWNGVSVACFICSVPISLIL